MLHASIEEDAVSAIKRALLLGDFDKAEKLLAQSQGVLSQSQISEIHELIQKSRFGVTDPEVYARVYEIARRLS